MTNNEIFTKVIRKNGVDYQLNVAIEEMSELTKEICKFKRNRGDLDHIAEEVADVEIMCAQLRQIFCIAGMVDHWKERKILRLGENLLK